jgi:hypothetical protein
VDTIITAEYNRYIKAYCLYVVWSAYIGRRGAMGRPPSVVIREGGEKWKSTTLDKILFIHVFYYVLLQGEASSVFFTAVKKADI